MNEIVVGGRNMLIGEVVDVVLRGEVRFVSPPFAEYLQFEGNVIEYLKLSFSKYKELLDDVDAGEFDDIDRKLQDIVTEHNKESAIEMDLPQFDLRRDIRAISDAILKALSAYFNGFIHRAYSILEDAFLANEGHLLKLLPQLYLHKHQMVRIRRNPDSLERKEFLHVPFDKRERCGTYRFSVLGYPSLYLATTEETARRELGLDVGDRFAKAYFCTRPEVEMHLVDLSLAGFDRKSVWEVYSMLLFYPLVIACGLKRKRDGAFHQEYVIPQIFTEIVRTHGDMCGSVSYDGIAYNSTKYEVRNLEDLDQLNLVIFIRNAEGSTGFSPEISAKFSISEPTWSCVREQGE